tara:strand:+ start:114 stop:491 length:378 start_codon:yes stop_codon:yes gene_type:complete
MLRSVKSTQRKIRQLELILKKEAGADLAASGPASHQVKSVTDGSGVISIVLKQAFAGDVVVIGNSSEQNGRVRAKTDNGKGTTADPIKLIHMDASNPSTEASAQALSDDEEITLLIIGSDVTEKY